LASSDNLLVFPDERFLAGLGLGDWFEIVVGDKVYLKLGNGYTTPINRILTKKLAQRDVGRFTVLERIGQLAYLLDFPGEFQGPSSGHCHPLEASTKG
jgi:hypothetical protein